MTESSTTTRRRWRPTSLGRDFSALWVGSGISNLGDGIRITASPLLATRLTDSPFLIALVVTVQFLPWLLLGPAGGALVDRLRRREMILATQAWRALSVGALAALTLAGAVQLWHLYVVTFLITLGEILTDPAVGALLPTVVEDRDLERANGRLFGTEIATNEFAGGPVGSVLFTVAPWLPFAVDAASFGLSNAFFVRLPSRPAPAPEQPTRLSTEIAEGARWLLRHPFLGRFAMVLGLANFGAIASFALLVLLVTDDLGGSDLTFGLVIAVGAVGGFTGTLLARRASERFGRRRVLVMTMAIEGVTILATAVAPSIPVLLAVWFVLTIQGGVFPVVSRSLLQRVTPNRLLGRINTTTRVFTRGPIVLGSAAMGALATVTSVRFSIAVGAVFDLVAAILMWRVLRGHDLEPRDAGGGHD